MLKTFVLSTGISNTYEKNSIIHWFRSLPLIGKHIPYEAYGNSVIRVLAHIIMVFKRISTFCLSELIYIGGILAASMAAGAFDGFEFFADSFFEHVFLGGLLIGMLVNSQLFDPTEDKYYSIVLMRLDARKTVLSHFIYGLIRKLTGYLIMALPVCLIAKVNFFIYLALVIATIMGKFVGARIKLVFVEKDKIGTHSGITLAAIVVITVIFAGLVLLGNLVTPLIILVISLLITVVGVFSFKKFWAYENYRDICKVFLTEDKIFIKETAKKKTKNNEKVIASDVLKKVDIKATEESNKKGYAYFNELFFKRHRKILGNRTRLLCIVLLAITTVCTLGLTFLKIRNGEVSLPINLSMVIMCAPFLMYFINTGESVTNAMFINCDSAMLTYNFYRTPSVILGVFKQRLLMLIRLNILPSILIATILSIVTWFSGEPYYLVDYVSLYVIFISLSVFFSVHRLVIYYLLQPYTEGMEKKSSAYAIVNSLTYVVSYMLFTMKSDLFAEPKTFAIITFAFSVIYIVIALLLVYKLAPRRFKIRRG